MTDSSASSAAPPSNSALEVMDQAALEVEMTKAVVLDDKPVLFVMTLPQGVKPMLEALRGVHNHWDYIWRKQGVEPSPGLLILHHGTTLATVGAGELSKLGLMRIPAPDDKEERENV